MTEPGFSCFVVRKGSDGSITASMERQPRSALPAGEVLIRVRYSSLNYKDAMAATGNAGIVKTFPHVPGIDAAGIVQESSDPRYTPGMQVIATGHELGVERWGGWSDYVRVPADWLVPLPAGLSLEEAMILGTAGFTAAQCVQALLHQGVMPEKGPVAVTGATGGVGSVAVMLLSQLGFQVVAVSGKGDQTNWLKSLGAAEVAGRDLLTDPKNRPLLSAKFAGGVDTVGGSVLTNLCKMIQHRGCVACCGVAGGGELGLTVYPFILRGLTLSGIDSAWCPDDVRAEIWKKLATTWKPKQLQAVKRIVPRSKMQPEVEKILKGENVGRVVVDVESIL
ncbi:oxidoreductase [Planctomicrobium piriforme]|uniref:Putative quinone oxidoreductase, YhdH/YhfP family n=1 Tax=Planctomicrobium piriforme TaxID=1576369 RepID=A0A1I3LZ07_9PLAN|nr:oxidoreductase [Planctomicrobium piriforme]SFI89933.1 putative quinone oxidoreductase, YhdH/YhfP family [Planctomicrobium piriforme]